MVTNRHPFQNNHQHEEGVIAIPDYQSLMLPLFKLAADDTEHSIRDVRERLAAELRLTDAERSQYLPLKIYN